MKPSTDRVYNFGAGPAALPEVVLKQAQAELLNWNHTGMSILEIGHRTPHFIHHVAEKSETDLRASVNIPTPYRVLFLARGGQSQFGMVPLNLLSRSAEENVDYADTSIWS